jgi:heptosyltransferase-2
MRQRPFHILAVRFSSLGDVILCSPVMSFIKMRWGDSVHLSFMTSKTYAPLMEQHPHIDSVHTISRRGGIGGAREVLRVLSGIQKERPVDLLLDLHGTLRSLLMRAAFPSIPRIALDKRTPERTILTLLKTDFLSRQGPSGRPRDLGELLVERNPRDFQHIFDADFDRETLSNFVENGTSKRLHQGQLTSCVPAFNHPVQGLLEKIPGLERGRYICIIPSASFPEKRWPLQKFKELLERSLSDPDFIAKQFVVLAGPEDDFCRIFDALEVDFPGRFFNLQGKTNLLESAMLLKEAIFCVGNDTGLPHIAESVGTPAIFILGPTGEEFGFYPHLHSSAMISLKMWCRPCTTNGKGRCLRGRRHCLEDISVEQVFSSMKNMIGETA